MAIAQTAKAAKGHQEIPIRKITLLDLRAALSQGWEDFLDKRGDLIFLGIIYPIAVLLASLYALKLSLLPIVFPLFAGTALLGPIFATGYYEIARRRECNLDSRWRHVFDALKGPSAFSIVCLSAVLFLLFAVWVIVAYTIYRGTMGSLNPATVTTATEFVTAVFNTPEGQRMMVVGNLVGLGFALVALAISVISFPMLVDRPVGWATALRTSVRVAWHNPVTTVVWGLVVVALLIVGALPALVGLAVIFPVLAYATWHLYTRAVGR